METILSLHYHWRSSKNGIVYFTQEGTDVKIQLQAGQEYPLQGLKEICYQKAREHGGIPLFKYQLRRKTE